MTTEPKERTMEPVTDSMTGDEFIALLVAVLTPLQRGMNDGGMWPPEVFEVDAAMTALVNRWFRYDVKARLAEVEKERDAIAEEFKCKVCGCGTPRSSCNGGLRHVAREYDGGMGCETCPDTPRVVSLPEEPDRYYCTRELLDHLCHEQFENDCRLLTIEKTRTRLSAAVETLREIADAVPTNWLDPILTGPSAQFSDKKAATTNVEHVLRAVKERIRAKARAFLETMKEGT